MKLAIQLAASTAMFVGASVFASAAAAARLMMHARRLIMGNNTAPGEELIGQVVEYRGDRRWHGLVLGTTSKMPGWALLQVQWARPEQFIGLAEIDDVIVVHDPMVKDRYASNRR
jgi:hypothetical protein